MGDRFKIGGSEYGRVHGAGGFCFESFTLYEMVYKLPKGAENLLIDGIDGALEKEEGNSKLSEYFAILYLALEGNFIAPKSPLYLSLNIKFSSPLHYQIVILLIKVDLIFLAVIIFS